MDLFQVIAVKNELDRKKLLFESTPLVEVVPEQILMANLPLLSKLVIFNSVFFLHQISIFMYVRSDAKKNKS